MEPTTLTVGGSFTVSAADCLNEDSTPGDVQVDVFNEHREEPQSFQAPVDDDGTWSLELQSEEADIGLNGVTATCFVSPESDEIVAEYDFVLVTVNATQATPTTDQPPATPPPAPPPAPPIAAPATPQQGEPTFTG